MQNEYDILIDYICNYIAPNKLHKREFGIYIGKKSMIDIRYNHRLYHLDVIKIEDNFYWELKPHFEKCYQTIIDDYESFDRVLFAIRENDRVMNNRK